MKFHTDHYFSIGQSHVARGGNCQDYTLSGVLEEGAAYSIVSDGCSTGRYTDVGARVLAFSTATAIRRHWQANERFCGDAIASPIHIQQQRVLTEVRASLGLEHQDMYASSVYGCLSAAGGFISVLGDGVIAFKYRDGTVRMSRFDWENNMPYYAAYGESAELYAGFIANHGGDLDAPRLEQATWRWDGNEFTQLETKNWSLRAGMKGVLLPVDSVELSETLAGIALFSDGVLQVENVEWKKVVLELLAFKTITGEFLKRRMSNALKNFRLAGKGPLDDISGAVILLEPDAEGGLP